MIRFALVCVVIALGAPLAVSAQEAAPPAEVAAWVAFCERLEAEGAAILREHPQAHEIDRAEALRYLADQLAAAVRQVNDDRDRAFPILRLGASTRNKWGFDGADAKYVGARIDGSGVYRLHGRLGDARIIAVQTAVDGARYQAFDSVQRAGLGANEAGEFEILVAAERPEGWEGAFLPTHADANMLLVREYFADWENEPPSSWYLERLDAVAAPAPMDLESGRRILDDVAALFAQRAPLWLYRSEPARDQLRNRVHANPSDEVGQGLAGNVYGSGAFDLASGEALLISLDEPEALLWSFQIGNIWWESLDYVNRTASLNSEQAFVNADGRVRIVIANEDPGVPNWLDAAGHPSGQILFRFQQTRNHPVPAAEVVELSSLRERLPADTPDVTAEQRAAEIAARRDHAARRWAP